MDTGALVNSPGTRKALLSLSILLSLLSLSGGQVEPCTVSCFYTSMDILTLSTSTLTSPIASSTTSVVISSLSSTSEPMTSSVEERPSLTTTSVAIVPSTTVKSELTSVSLTSAIDQSSSSLSTSAMTSSVNQQTSLLTPTSSVIATPTTSVAMESSTIAIVTSIIVMSELTSLTFTSAMTSSEGLQLSPTTTGTIAPSTTTVVTSSLAVTSSPTATNEPTPQLSTSAKPLTSATAMASSVDVQSSITSAASIAPSTTSTVIDIQTSLTSTSSSVVLTASLIEPSASVSSTVFQSTSISEQVTTAFLVAESTTVETLVVSTPLSSAGMTMSSSEILQTLTLSTASPQSSTNNVAPPSTTSLLVVMPSVSAMPSPDTTTADRVTTADSAVTSSILDLIRDFFAMLPMNALIGICVGVGVVLLLLLIICILCCCCICKQVRNRRRRKRRVDLTSHRKSLTISNPIAFVSSSEHNGSAPARYRSTVHDSSDCSDGYDMHDLDQEPFKFPSTEYRETSVDDHERSRLHQASQVGHATQPSQMTQMSTATDLFRERSLPKLSPLSYSSQFLTAPQFPNHYPSLSVDATNDPHTSLIGDRRQSLMALVPNQSPSLRVPTLMALSLKNEETKSAQGSKVSVHGSRTSIQGSRPSMHSSRGSVHTGTGSRSQIYSSNLSSREHSALLLNGPREFGGTEDDVISLQFSGRGVSPAMKQSSLEEVPTRDSPVPELASHAVGYGKKDFASLTCIPNRYAVETDHLEQRQQLSTVPEKQAVENEVTAKKDSSTETKKKPRSRAMSKLEKLTSLDYIRASLRLKKKKVSFENAPESPKEKKKGSKASCNGKDKDHEKSEAKSYPAKDLHHTRRHSASARGDFSPHGKTPPASANKFPDHFYYPQLSQPMYYGGPPHMIHPAMLYQYPQLSQQFYAQLSQGGYGAAPYPAHMVYPGGMVDPYSPGYGGDPTSRYANMITPDELYDDTPEPEFYQERSPDNVLEGRQQQPNGFSGKFQSPEHSSGRPTSPDRFTETSDTSSYLMHPPSASHIPDDPLTSAHRHFMNEFVMDRDHYGYYDHHAPHIPTYPSEMMARPHPEAYAYQPPETPQEYEQQPPQQTGQAYTQYPGYGDGTAAPRRQSRSSYASSTSDQAPVNDMRDSYDQPEPSGAEVNSSTATGASKTKVSWSAEVIEYQRTPSDLADSDFDFNQF